MQRNSFTLFLESPGATTPIPWVNDAPDFSSFTEPTLSVLQQSWQEFLDSGQELEIISDPEPFMPTMPPDWDGLYTSLMVSNIYAALVNLGLQIPAVSLALAASIDAIQYGILKGDSAAALPAFQSSISLLLSVLSSAGQPLSAEQLAEVRTILDNNGFDLLL